MHIMHVAFLWKQSSIFWFCKSSCHCYSFIGYKKQIFLIEYITVVSRLYKLLEVNGLLLDYNKCICDLKYYL